MKQWWDWNKMSPSWSVSCQISWCAHIKFLCFYVFFDVVGPFLMCLPSYFVFTQQQDCRQVCLSATLLIAILLCLNAWMGIPVMEKCISPLYDLDFWPLTLNTFSAIISNLMAIPPVSKEIMACKIGLLPPTGVHWPSSTAKCSNNFYNTSLVINHKFSVLTFCFTKAKNEAEIKWIIKSWTLHCLLQVVPLYENEDVKKFQWSLKLLLNCSWIFFCYEHRNIAKHQLYQRVFLLLFTDVKQIHRDNNDSFLHTVGSFSRSQILFSELNWLTKYNSNNKFMVMQHKQQMNSLTMKLSAHIMPMQCWAKSQLITNNSDL